MNCSALDRSISAGNRLLALDKKQLEDEIGREVDFKVTDLRRKYAAQMLNQYTNELERKRETNCRTSGDKELDYSQQERDNTLNNLGSQGQGQLPPSMQVQQAGMGGGTMVYLAIGAIALAGFFFLKSTMNKGGAPAPAPAPAPTPTPSA